MSHDPYDEWLLTDEELTEEQRQELDAHLETCEECRQIASAWQAVETRLLSVPEAVPDPGFTQRWQVQPGQTAPPAAHPPDLDRFARLRRWCAGYLSGDLPERPAGGPYPDHAAFVLAVQRRSFFFNNSRRPDFHPGVPEHSPARDFDPAVDLRLDITVHLEPDLDDQHLANTANE